MNRSREKIDYRPIERVYGPFKSVMVRELFYESWTGKGYTRPAGWSPLEKPIYLEEAADTIATRYGLIVAKAGGGRTYPEYLREELIKPRFNRDKPRIYRSGRLALIFCNDPDTPVLVEYRVDKSETLSGTYNCVSFELAVDGHPLSETHIRWIDEFEGEVEAWYETVRSRQEARYGQG